jgi:anthranilate phosphoribosyltransferase
MRKDFLAKVAAGQHLTREEALDVGRDLAAGRSEPLQCAAFLAALAARGETSEELTGLAKAFIEAATPMRSFPGAVDTCGTGGDGRGTFNLSTTAALAAAALGATVAKHGNRSISSACGSADLLERAGVAVDSTPREAEERLEHQRFCFLFAPRFHPAMAHVAQVRRELGFRTVFNLLGPLLNPAGVQHQVVGVFDAPRQSLVAQTLLALGTERALVIHGHGGYDEAVLHGPVSVIEMSGGVTQRYEVSASDFGLPQGQPQDLAGGSVAQNAGIFETLLAGDGPSGLRNAVAANCALALRSCGICEDLREGAGRAAEALGTGEVGRFVDGLRGTLLEAPRAQVS